MKEALEFQPNVPVEVALAYAEGKPVQGKSGERLMYTLVGDRVMFLDVEVGQKIAALGIKPREPFWICKGVSGKKGDPIEWRVWRRVAGEQADGTFVVPNGKPAPATATPQPLMDRPKTKLEDALKTVVAACHATREYAKQIGYDMPVFNGDEMVRMVNTLMINGNGKNGGPA